MWQLEKMLHTNLEITFQYCTSTSNLYHGNNPIHSLHKDENNFINV